MTVLYTGVVWHFLPLPKTYHLSLIFSHGAGFTNAIVGGDIMVPSCGIHKGLGAATTERFPERS